ncbi:MAG: hypothetical protein SFT81_04860 [Candidatus Caenarcaniphilales bacterium]|nr:hypothetical protein [Candidatus Caenarcaniphilales bacterium]
MKLSLRAKLAIGFTIVFFSGLVIGGVLMYKFGVQKSMLSSSPFARDRFESFIFNRISNRMQLNDHQKEQIRPIIKKMVFEIIKARHEQGEQVYKVIDRHLNQIKDQLGSELNQEQLAMLERIRDKQHKKWLGKNRIPPQIKHDASF